MKGRRLPESYVHSAFSLDEGLREAEEWGASTLLQFRSDYFGAPTGTGEILAALGLSPEGMTPDGHYDPVAAAPMTPAQ